MSRQMPLNRRVGAKSSMPPKLRSGFFDVLTHGWVPRLCLPLWMICFQFMASADQFFAVSEPSASMVCPYVHLPDLLLPWEGKCEPSEERVILEEDPQSENENAAVPSRVVELNETTLEQALALVRSRDATYMMILFYAEWCPFSKDFRPTYDVLSTLFPSIYHVAVEGTTLRPSVLSKNGIHSFPSLFLLNKVSRNRYRSSRELKDLIIFLENTTGLKPLTKGKFAGREIGGLSDFLKKSNGNSELCPFPRGLSSWKWLQDDTYLMLATWFVILRILMPIVPWAFAKMKLFWNRRHVHVFARLRLFIALTKEASRGTRAVEIAELKSRDIARRWSRTLFA